MKRLERRKGKVREATAAKEIHYVSLDEVANIPDSVELDEDFYLRLARQAIRHRKVSLAVVLLASRQLMLSSIILIGERRHDGSGLLDLALPPLDAMDAIATLDSERERWVEWYGYGGYLSIRRRAAIRIVISHYGWRLAKTVSKAIRLKLGRD